MRTVTPAHSDPRVGVRDVRSPGSSTRTSAEQADGPRERTLFVSAVDKKGEPVSGLGPDAFVVREDGVRREVLRVSRATEPIDIALLVDNSQPPATRSRSSARRSRSSWPRWRRATTIALIALADRPTILVDYTTTPSGCPTASAGCSRCRRAA